MATPIFYLTSTNFNHLPFMASELKSSELKFSFTGERLIVVVKDSCAQTVKVSEVAKNFMNHTSYLSKLNPVASERRSASRDPYKASGLAFVDKLHEFYQVKEDTQNSGLFTKTFRSFCKAISNLLNFLGEFFIGKKSPKTIQKEFEKAYTEDFFKTIFRDLTKEEEQQLSQQIKAELETFLHQKSSP